MLPPTPAPVPALDRRLGGAALLLVVAGAPLGLARPGAADLVTAGHDLVAPAAGAPPLGALLVKAFSCLPLGDLATRANLASAVAAGLAAFFLVRLVAEALAATRRPESRLTDATLPGAGMVVGLSAPQPRAPSWERLRGPEEMTAVIAGALAPLLCLGVFLAVTSAGSASVTLAVLSAGWLSGWRLWRNAGRTRDGLTLAAATGLSLGVDPVAPLLLVLPALALWWRSFRRGERWPLLAPAVSLAGASVAFHPGSRADAPMAVADLLREALLSAQAIASAAARARLHPPAAEVVGELGVVAGLVALVGLVVMIARAPLGALWVMMTGLIALAVAATGAGSSSAGWAALMAAIGVPLAVGIVHLASRLGAARLPAAVVVAVVALAPVALDGGARRWQRPTRVTERLLAEAESRLPPRASVDPGSPSMAALLRYGQSLGHRPDLSIIRSAPPSGGARLLADRGRPGGAADH